MDSIHHFVTVRLIYMSHRISTHFFVFFIEMSFHGTSSGTRTHKTIGFKSMLYTNSSMLAQWCMWWDSNPHPVCWTRLSTVCVYHSATHAFEWCSSSDSNRD